ncbi:MAG: hypothetical protein KTR35_16305 [Gammaproteobacteria bacterium]|nr:hypothetical protein [Gammaproteobacteria bacterium]
MKILYGVQGTGNGHITRARCLAREFDRLGLEVDYVFSGRDKNKYFGMEVFGDARFFEGLTFETRNNKIDHLSTIKNLRPFRFVHELKQIHLDSYDLVISDFEPLTAWRSRFSKTPSLGIGHQYSFISGAPWPKHDVVGRLVLRYFAPVQRALGVHWHHFDGTVLPPLIDVRLKWKPSEEAFVLVYLPFANSESALEILLNLPSVAFKFYSPQHKERRQVENVTIEPLSKEGFRQDLRQCRALVSSCGFGLVSEALHMGIPILTIPVQGQGEQIANAMALEQLGLGESNAHLNSQTLSEFMERIDSTTGGTRSPMNYPDVASAVADYCASGAHTDPKTLVDRLWQSTSAA